MRYDHFTDVGSSYTPKLGHQMDADTRARPARHLRDAASARRAPAENGARRPGRILDRGRSAALRAGRASSCNPASVALITSPNPDLSPERSKSYTLGHDLGPASAHEHLGRLLEHQAQDEINQEQADAAIAAGHVARDPSARAPSRATRARSPRCWRSTSTRRRPRCAARYRRALQRFRLPDDLGQADVRRQVDAHLTNGAHRAGRHLARLRRHARQLRRHQLHRARRPTSVNLRLGWDQRDCRVSLNVNYRARSRTRFFKGDPAGCAVTFANGADAPAAANWLVHDASTWSAAGSRRLRWRVFGSIQNLFDKVGAARSADLRRPGATIRSTTRVRAGALHAGGALFVLRG